MSQALSGLKVLDLTMNLPGPYMTWLLADMGADVVKIENPVGGDYARALGASPSGKNSLFFEAVNRNKKSVGLNLKHPEGRRLFLELLDTYDVVAEGFRPGTMDNLDLSFETMSKRQPRVIQVSISGYGQDGPNRLRAGHDVNYLSLAGIIGVTGTKEGESVIPGIQIADLAGGSLMAMTGLLAAVIQRQNTGKGQMVDVSMFHGSLSLATMIYSGVASGMDQPIPGGMFLTGKIPCYRLYRTKDDRYMSLGALEFKFWQNFCTAVDRQDLMGNQFGGPEIIDELVKIFASRTLDEWVALMKDHDSCCEPVLKLDDAVNSELVKSRNMIQQIEEGQQLLASPLSFSDSPSAEYRPSPGLGEHTQEILSQLGLSKDDFERLSSEGVI
jgi:alpha-methylacyl-CoA racemase